MLPAKIAFVDIETSGGRPTYDRIIEIGILRVEEGKLIHTYQTLINPELYISPFIENLTGIAHRDLESAPTFRHVMDEISDALSDCIFAAHNARFDYSFLKNEFARFGKSFSPKQLCTVKLSRLLFPRYKQHNLDSLIERFGFDCHNRHRAFDDAKIIWDFYQFAQKSTSLENFEKACAHVLKRPSRPINISEEDLNLLPEGPGVYIFFGSEGAKRLRSPARSQEATADRRGSIGSISNKKNSVNQTNSVNSLVPLYIGKSINIRDRVLSHFVQTHASGFELSIAEQVHHIEAIETAGELGALFLESTLIKEKQPLYNRKLRLKREVVILRKTITEDGYTSAEIQTVTKLILSDIDSIFGVFRSKKQAKDMVLALCKKHSLCQKLFGLEKTNGSCFGYHLGWCHGACKKKELPVKYNIRLTQAFSDYKLKAWPFDTPIVIQEKNLLTGTSESFLVDQWCLLGSVTKHEESDMTHEYIFDLDTYKILVNYIFNKKNQKNIKLFPSQFISKYSNHTSL